MKYKSYYDIFIVDISVHKTLNECLQHVSNILNIPIKRITLKNRMRENVEAKQLFCKYAKTHTSYSHSQIGKVIGRDHATVTHSIKQVDNVKELQEKYKLL